MEDNSDADYTYGKRICNDFKICAFKYMGLILLIFFLHQV